jgi:hypothetical protein
MSGPLSDFEESIILSGRCWKDDDEGSLVAVNEQNDG